MTERLRHAAKTLAAHRHDGLAVVFLGLGLRDRLDVIADQADGAFGLHRDALVEREQNLDLVHDLRQLLVAAEDDVLFLEVGSELHRHEGVDAGGADVVVATGGPGVLTAADRAVADVDHVLDRTPHHALRAGVGATADRHHARNGLDVRFHAAVGLAFLERAEVLGAPLGVFFGVCLQHLVDELLVAGFGVFKFGCGAETHMITSLIVGVLERPAPVEQGRPSTLGGRGRLSCQFGGRSCRRAPRRRAS